MTRRFSTGMSGVVLYTYSHAIDNASSFSGTGGTVSQNPNDWRPERGPSSFDQRHKISFTYTLSSPVGVRGFMRNGGWKTHALAGWTLNGTYNIATGTPITATLGGPMPIPEGWARLGARRGRGDRSFRSQRWLPDSTSIRRPSPRRRRGNSETRAWTPSGPVPAVHQRHAQPRLAHRRMPPPIAIPAQRHQPVEPRHITGFGTAVGLHHLRSGDGRVGHPLSHRHVPIQFLMKRP